MSDKLKEICENKLVEVKALRAKKSQYLIEEEAKRSNFKQRGFISAIENKLHMGKEAIIAEVKKASPSKGVIRENFNPVQLAIDYERAGAACVSVLTERKYFQGCEEYLTEIRNNVSLPLLRKDFMLDPYQVFESKILGADCILLIMAALGDSQAKELEEAARQLDLDVLIEVHDEVELKRALQLKSKLIGVNNRNLKSLRVDLSNSEKMSKLIPASQDYIIVCESGIEKYSDIVRMNNIGINTFLVGESLMRQEDVYDALIKLLDLNN